MHGCIALFNHMLYRTDLLLNSRPTTSCLPLKVKFNWYERQVASTCQIIHYPSRTCTPYYFPLKCHVLSPLDQKLLLGQDAAQSDLRPAVSTVLDIWQILSNNVNSTIILNPFTWLGVHSGMALSSPSCSPMSCRCQWERAGADVWIQSPSMHFSVTCSLRLMEAYGVLHPRDEESPWWKNSGFLSEHMKDVSLQSEHLPSTGMWENIYQ